MNRGKVKWFNTKRGFGCITSDEGRDIFVHYTGLNMTGYKKLRINDEVEYDVAENERGPLAVNVTKIA